MPARQRLLRRRTSEVTAIEANGAAARRKSAGDQIEQRGLARAVRPDDADRLARRDRKIEVVGDDDRAEAFPEAGNFQQHGTSTRQRDQAMASIWPPAGIAGAVLLSVMTISYLPSLNRH